MGDAGKKSWSFISENSFSARSDVPMHMVDLAPNDSMSEATDLATDMVLFHDKMQQREQEQHQHQEQLQQQQQQQPSRLQQPPLRDMGGGGAAAPSSHQTYPKSAIASRVPRSKSMPRRKMTVTFKEERESIPISYRRSSAPSPSIQLLEEPAYQRPRDRSNTPENYFNHQLYGSLRTGESVDLFSRQYLGLAFTAAASGFMVPFLEDCFHPLLSVYLHFDEEQRDATQRFLLLPGVISFFIGVLSDFYPIWSFHRKSYMLGGWVFAYLNLMALVIIAMIDDQTAATADNVRTFYGGIVYVWLMMGTSLGVTIASVSAIALLVELSQREGIHERGDVMLKYLITKNACTLVSVIVTSQIMDYDEITGRTRSLLSLKVVLLWMALVALVPIPAVLFRLYEEKREIKVDAVDRSSLAHQLWNIIQQQAVWRIILFICASLFLVFFQFDNATAALAFWAEVTPDATRIGDIPVQCMTVGIMCAYRAFMLNYSWVRVSFLSLLLYVAVNLLATIPVIFDGGRSPWYFLSVMSLTGIPLGTTLIIGLVPLIEIAETGIEGATTGLVSSYDVLIRSVVATFSDGIGRSSTSLVYDFPLEVLAEDTRSTRWRVFAFIMGKCAVNCLALVPILYLLPHQKLDAQQMRTYGGYNRAAGISIATLFVLLVIYAGTVNILSLLHKY